MSSNAAPAPATADPFDTMPTADAAATAAPQKPKKEKAPKAPPAEKPPAPFTVAGADLAKDLGAKDGAAKDLAAASEKPGGITINEVAEIAAKHGTTANALIGGESPKRTLQDIARDLLEIQAAFDGLAEKVEQLTDPDFETVDKMILAAAQKLEATDEELTGKVECWIKVISRFQGDAEIAGAEARRLSARSKGFEMQAKRMKDALCNTLDAIGRSKFKSPLFTIWTQANPKSIEVLDEAIAYVPSKFFRPPPPLKDLLDKKGLADAIFKGEIAAPKGVTVIDTKRHLRWQ